ncbi:GNAT family N-acetyltransferase [Ruania halotolerans]|uniref:GNAT family N-acetyltransferase n=1 Tax=Ruania halotolerans TaxID=2897773 RepID=UPI001E624882|nr:GNAT family protein [Ruania halotolerans]UFU07309.1 GNAT family N-acetyltransferase [Ruania halotolerans]
MELVSQGLRLRPLRRRDRSAWEALRRRNAAWLAPWEATSPDVRPYRPTFGQYVRDQARAAREDTGYSFVMDHRGELVGQVTIAGVTRGSLQAASIGYWISEHMAGRGITPLAVAMAADYCWFSLRLHRVEINIRPENAASLRVVAKLGFREEGLRRGYLHIQGTWADHRSFALNREEVGAGLVAALAN